VVIRDLSTGAVGAPGAPHPDGHRGRSTDAWWSALQQALAAAGGLDDVAAISDRRPATRHGCARRPVAGVVRPALLWNDTRSAAAATALADEVGARGFARRTGSVPVASFTLAKLRWLTRQTNRVTPPSRRRGTPA